MMYFAAVLFLSLGVWGFPDDKYTNQYDSINIEDVLGNDRLLKVYYDCILGTQKDKCPREANELKAIVPDAIQSECSKCNDVQKSKAKQVLNFLEEKKPDHFKTLLEKFDPEGIHYKRYKAGEIH